MSFADGGKPQGGLDKGEETDTTGTTQTFYPDTGIFEFWLNSTSRRWRARFQQMAFLNKGLRITLTDERVTHRSLPARTMIWTLTASPPKAKSTRTTAPLSTSTTTGCWITSST